MPRLARLPHHIPTRRNFGRRLAALALLGLAVVTCSRVSIRTSQPQIVALVNAFGGLTFSSAVDLIQHPTDDGRWYVVERTGVVETFHESDPAGTRAIAVVVPGVLLTGENGLLGMAFHPDFVTSGELFLSYVVDTGGVAGTSTIARYLSLDGGLTFVPDPGPDPIVLTLVQPYSNHNGGDLDFGPDGMLYVAFGDGGGSGDPDGNGQDLSDWFGSILRLDVDGARPYAIPADNPFVGIAGLDEIWAYGLRNPWRMSFDPITGLLWAVDVGQHTVEEIDVIVSGGNYGWNLQEGDLAYPSLQPAAPPGLLPPVSVHLHPESASITGGFVYRGSMLPFLAGHYVYGDFVTGRLFEFDAAAGSPMLQEIFKGPINVSSFGQGRDGEMYVVAYGGAEPLRKIAPLQ